MGRAAPRVVGRAFELGDSLYATSPRVPRTLLGEQLSLDLGEEPEFNLSRELEQVLRRLEDRS
jgi:hypothetical protein